MQNFEFILHRGQLWLFCNNKSWFTDIIISEDDNYLFLSGRKWKHVGGYESRWQTQSSSWQKTKKLGDYVILKKKWSERIRDESNTDRYEDEYISSEELASLRQWSHQQCTWENCKCTKQNLFFRHRIIKQKYHWQISAKKRFSGGPVNWYSGMRSKLWHKTHI